MIVIILITIIIILGLFYLEMVKREFEKMDKDGDKKVSSDEAKDAWLQPQDNEAHFRKTFNKWDLNGDGHVDLDEFNIETGAVKINE